MKSKSGSMRYLGKVKHELQLLRLKAGSIYESPVPENVVISTEIHDPCIPHKAALPLALSD